MVNKKTTITPISLEIPEDDDLNVEENLVGGEPRPSSHALAFNIKFKKRNTLSIRHDLDKKDFFSDYAAGGIFSSRSSHRAMSILQTILELPAERCAAKFKESEGTTQNLFVENKREIKNVYLILSGFAMINEREDIYSLCREKLGKKSLGEWETAYLRTDEKIRKSLNLTLHSAILNCEPKYVDMVLVWARRNTMTLHINDEWIQVALRITDQDGPGQGDRTLLSTLLNHKVVIVPLPKDWNMSPHQKLRQGLLFDRSETNPVKGQTPLMAMMKRAVTMRLQKHIQESSKLSARGLGHENEASPGRRSQSFEDKEKGGKMQNSRYSDENIDLKHRVAAPGAIKKGAFQESHMNFSKNDIDASNNPLQLANQSFQTDDMSDGAPSKRKTPQEKVKRRMSENFADIMQTENKEKYLKLYDLLEIQISNVDKKSATTDDVINVFVSLLDKVVLDDIERAIALLFDQDAITVVFKTIEILVKTRRLPLIKEELIIMSWLEALSRHWLHINMQIMTLYQNSVLSQDNRTLSVLVKSLRESAFSMDQKLAMIKKFLPKIKFKHVDMLVTNIQHIVEQSDQMDGIFICNINPFLVAATILVICTDIKRDFPLAKLRILQFEDKLIDSMITLLNNIYDPQKIRLMLKQTDPENFNTLALMGKLQLYKAMQTKVADRVIQDTWTSKVDVSGSFYENSTAYDFLTFKNLNDTEDFESKRRLYHTRDLREDIRPHGFAFRVWLESMSLRYFIEMAFFAVQVLWFQYYISQFNKDLHILQHDIDWLIEKGVFVQDESGRILSRSESDLVGRFTQEESYDIIEHKVHLAHEIELAVFELDEAMFVAMISWSFPCQIFMAWVFSKYTNRRFIMRSSAYLDLAVFTCILIWFEQYEVYIHDDNFGFNLTNPPHEYHRFMQRLLNDVNTGEFHFDWLLAATAFLFWIRLIFMLQLTSVFGPLIRTTMAMMQDLVTFFMLFTLQLIAFSCVGILAFGMLKPYETVWDAFILFFATSMGDFDLGMYEEMGPTKKYYGMAFHVIVILCNLLLMLNLVIAIMSDTYSRFAEVQLGLYSNGIIEAIPSYKNDKRYGGLIVMTPPINMLAYLMWPVYHCIKDKSRLAKFNRGVSIVIYFPFGVVFTLVFLASCLVMTPFAWMKIVIHKFSLGGQSGQRLYILSGIFYALFGLPILVLTALVDSMWFFRHLYQWDMPKVGDANIYPKISLKAFNRFYKTVNRHKGNACNAKQLVLQLRNQFRTTECIFGVLYTNKTSEEVDKMSHKFMDQKSSMEVLQEGIDYNLRGLNTYNLFKRVVWSCSTHRPNDELDEFCDVNLPLLKGYLDEVKNEIFVEDINLKLADDPDYRGVEVDSIAGYSDYKPVSDHEQIQKQVAQVTLIDPWTIMQAFGILSSQTGDNQAGSSSNRIESQSTTAATKSESDKRDNGIVSPKDITMIDTSSSKPTGSNEMQLAIQLLYECKQMIQEQKQITEDGRMSVTHKNDAKR